MPKKPVAKENVGELGVIQQLSASVKKQMDWLECDRQEKKVVGTEKKDKFEDVPEWNKSLTLNASFENGEVIPLSPCKNFKNAHSQSLIGKAKQLFLCVLSAKEKRITEVQTGTIAALHVGVFLRDRKNNPSNFTLFAFCKRKLLSPFAAKQ